MGCRDIVEIAIGYREKSGKIDRILCYISGTAWNFCTILSPVDRSCHCEENKPSNMKIGQTDFAQIEKPRFRFCTVLLKNRGFRFSAVYRTSTNANIANVDC